MSHVVQHSAFTQEDELSLQDEYVLHQWVPTQPEPALEDSKSCLQGSMSNKKSFIKGKEKESFCSVHVGSGERSYPATHEPPCGPVPVPTPTATLSMGTSPAWVHKAKSASWLSLLQGSAPSSLTASPHPRGIS